MVTAGSMIAYYFSVSPVFGTNFQNLAVHINLNSDYYRRTYLTGFSSILLHLYNIDVQRQRWKFIKHY